jgi:signal transduction histidine kinase
MFGIFLTFAFYGIFTFDLSISEMKKLLGTRNEGFTFNMMQVLDQTLDDRLTDFQDIAKTRFMKDTIHESNRNFADIPGINSYLENNGNAIKFNNQIEENDLFLRQLVDVNISNLLSEIIDFYNDVYNHEVVKELYITNEFGVIIGYGSGVSDILQNDEDWWNIAKNEGSYFGNLHFDDIYDNQVADFGFRINDDEGNFLGVLRVVIPVEDMVQVFINDAEIVNTEFRNVILTDGEGRIIYSKELQPASGIEKFQYFNHIKKGEDVGFLEITDNVDNLKLLSYAKSTGYRTFPGLDWIIIIEQDSSSFVSEFVELRNSILIVSIIGMSASIMIGLFISFFISKPLKEFSRMAKLIAKGNFEVRAKRSHINEFEIIGRSLNNMAQSLKKLFETEKLLAEANTKVKNERFTAMGELAASMAHELRNPLATVQSSSDIIKKSGIVNNKELDNVVQRMERAISKMSNQIESVLNYVRMTPINQIPTSINSILDLSLNSLEIPKNIELELPKEDYQINCDSKKMEIVFINLILNSIQAIGDSTGKIKIRIIDKDDFVLIEFEDTGEGITDDIFNKVFDPLVSTKEKGTGLGLSTCKNIIEGHHGTISVKNNPTIFTIELPKNGKNNSKSYHR